MFPSGSGAWLTAFGLLAIGGLVVAAMRGRVAERLVAQFSVLMIAVAFGGALIDRFPFGPTNQHPLSAGGRHTLWLVPALALGLAAIAHRVRSLVAHHKPLRFGFDVLAVLAAVSIVIAGYQHNKEAPFPGSATASQYTLENLGPGDVLILSSPSVFSFAITTDTPAALADTPTKQVGFAPDYLDPRIHAVGGWAAEPNKPADIRAWTADSDRVLVIGDGPVKNRGLDAAGSVLTSQGFTRREEVRLVQGRDLVSLKPQACHLRLHVSGWGEI